MMDKKIESKARKIEEEERIYQEKKKKEKEKIELIELEKMKQDIKLKKQKSKNEKKKNRKKKETLNNSLQCLPNIKSLPNNIAHLCKKGDVVYCVPGDGACGPNSISAHLFKDEVFGPKLRRKINDFKLEHWDKKYKHKTQCSEESPFVRKIGSGKTISFTNHQELFDYLKSAEDADYMWTECEDLIVVADMYQVNIKVITIRGEKDENPTVQWIYPDKDMKEFAELKDVEIDDIVLLHENDVHFNLIISEDNDLAKVGSLSFMNNLGPMQKELDKNELKTKTFAEVVANNPDKIKEEENDIKRLKNDLQKSNDRNEALRKQYDECEAALIKVTEEAEHLKSELKELREIMKLEKAFEKASKVTQESPPELTFKISPTKIVNNSKETKNNNTSLIEEEFNCLECAFQGTEQSQLYKHIQLKHRINCRNCEKTFKTRSEFMVHRKIEHYSSVALCRNGIECKFSDRCWWKHKKDHGNMIDCFLCEQSFQTKGEVMLHRKSVHPKTVKICNNFKTDKCTYTSCWFRHEIDEEESKVVNKTDANNSFFWKRQHNLKSP